MSKNEMLKFWVENPHYWKTVIAIQFLINSGNDDVLRNIDWNQLPKSFLADKYFSDNDIKEYSQSIRIFGTRKQIDKALDDYCDISGLNLDEVYDFEDKDKLKEYADQYKNKALIINLR